MASPIAVALAIASYVCQWKCDYADNKLFELDHLAIANSYLN